MTNAFAGHRAGRRGPRRREMVPRTELLGRWLAADPSVTVIHGPAGYGKTSLVEQYLETWESAETVLVWVAMDPLSRDPDTLVRRLARAVGESLPGFDHSEIDGLLDAHGDRAAEYAARLLVEAITGLDRPVVMVLDDCHHLGSAESRALVSEVINAAAQRVTFVVTSRGRPRLALSNLRLAGQLLEIDEADLRFTSAEARRLLLGSASDGEGEDGGQVEDGHRVADRGAVRDQVPGEDDPILELVGYAQGWVTALQMMALALAAGVGAGDLLARIRGGHERDLGDFLTENVLGSIQPDLLEVLEAVAVCGQVTPDLARRLTGREDAPDLLDVAVARSLFVTRSTGTGDVYTLHQAVGDHVVSRVRGEDPQRLRASRLTAAGWYLEQGRYGSAVEQALQVSPSAAADVVEAHAMGLIEDSRMAALVRLADKLPQHEKESRWRLMLGVAWANGLLQRAEVAQLHLDRARAALPVGEATPEVLAEMNVVQAIIHIFRDDLDPVPGLVDEAMDASFGPLVVGVAANARTVAYIASGELQLARDQQTWAQRFHLRCQGPFPGVYGRTWAGLAALEQLDLTAAGQLFGEAFNLAAEGSGLASHAAQLARGMRGEYLLEVGEHDEAVACLTAALELGSDGGLVDVMRASFGTLARAWHHAGRDDLALDLLDEGHGLAATLELPRLALELSLESMRIQLARGDRASAARIERDVRRLEEGPAAGRTSCRVTAHLARALFESANGHHAAAISMLDRVLELPGVSPRRRLLVQAQRCQALTAGGRPRQSMESLRTVVHTAARQHAVESVRTVARGLDAQLRELHADELLPRLERDFVAAVLRTPGDTAPPPTARRILRAPTEVPGGASQDQAGRGDVGVTGSAGPGGDQGASGGGGFVAGISEINEREVEVLELLEEGLTNQQIAERLFISVNTVKWHLKNIYLKLGATSRLGAIHVMREHRDGARRSASGGVADRPRTIR